MRKSIESLGSGHITHASPFIVLSASARETFAFNNILISIDNIGGTEENIMLEYYEVGIHKQYYGLDSAFFSIDTSNPTRFLTPIHAAPDMVYSILLKFYDCKVSPQADYRVTAATIQEINDYGPFHSREISLANWINEKED